MGLTRRYAAVFGAAMAMGAGVAAGGAGLAGLERIAAPPAPVAAPAPVAPVAGPEARPAAAPALPAVPEAREDEPAPPPPPWQEAQRRARAAHDAGDFQAYLAGVQHLFELLSGNPDTVFAMAKAEALLGHTAAALDWLNAYAAMGLTHDFGAEVDLVGLQQTAGFAAVRARLEANRRPVSRSASAFTLADPDLLPEDIAYDAGGRRFFVSSVRQAKIVAIDARSGMARDFVPAGRDGIWGVLALAIDGRRGFLWATTAAMPQTHGYRGDDDLGHSAVLRYELATGKLLRRYDLPVPPHLRKAPRGSRAGAVTVPPEERERVLGDMTMAENGDVYVSEAVTGAVYAIRGGGDAMETLVAPGVFASPQTPALTPDGRRLLVADYVRGIGIVELASRTVTWMAHPREVAVSGIDGMYLCEGSLIAVQNGTEPRRVVRLDLDPSLIRIVRWEALESNSPGLGEPTHGTIVGKDFFFLANSGWDRLAEDGSLKPGAAMTPAAVRRLAL
jgi:sugar lactone lactonase YvrE